MRKARRMEMRVQAVLTRLFNWILFIYCCFGSAVLPNGLYVEIECTYQYPGYLSTSSMLSLSLSFLLFFHFIYFSLSFRQLHQGRHLEKPPPRRDRLPCGTLHVLISIDDEFQFLLVKPKQCKECKFDNFNKKIFPVCCSRKNSGALHSLRRNEKITYWQ